MKKLFLGISLIIINSCGQPVVHKHLTDKFYLTAPDLIEQLSISYHTSGSSYLGIVNESVIGVGYNEDFIIVKQQSNKLDSIHYYIIAINEIKKEREKFKSKLDTIRFSSNYKDSKGNDSLGKEQTQIYKTQFIPKSPEPMTFESFKEKRLQMNVPKELDFTIYYN